MARVINGHMTRVKNGHMTHVKNGQHKTPMGRQCHTQASLANSTARNYKVPWEGNATPRLHRHIQKQNQTQQQNMTTQHSTMGHMNTSNPAKTSQTSIPIIPTLT
jgi:hypothetical protein